MLVLELPKGYGLIIRLRWSPENLLVPVWCQREFSATNWTGRRHAQ